MVAFSLFVIDVKNRSALLNDGEKREFYFKLFYYSADSIS